MTEAVTLNQARLHLGVGKEKLKRLLTETGIVPIQINRQRKEISLEQLEQLQQLLNNDPATSGLDSGQPVKTTGRPDKPTSQDYRSTGQPSPIDFEATIELALTKERLETAQKEISQLVNQLQSTETKLENQLQEAKEERLAERREREGYQMLMMKLQQDNQHLQQQLLEAPKYSKFDVDSAAEDVEDPTDISAPALATPTVQPTEYTPRSSSWGLGIGLGAVAAAIIFYVLVGDQGAKFFPKIQQKLVGALHLTDTTSIVPYQFDGDGTLR